MRYQLLAALVPGTIALAGSVMAASPPAPLLASPSAIRLVDDAQSTTDRARQLEADKNRARTLEKSQSTTATTDETDRARQLQQTKDRARTIEKTDGKSATETDRARELEATRARARTLEDNKVQ
jgi:hypothetical protein